MARRKQPKSVTRLNGPTSEENRSSIPNASLDYGTWLEGDEAGKARAMAGLAAGLMETEAVTGSQREFLNIMPGGISVRDGFDRGDYDSFRSQERIPTGHREVMAASYQAYNNHGIIHNVFDLMADLAIQGMDLEHPKATEKRFYREWFRRVDGYGRSSHFLKSLLVGANVPVKRLTAKLSPSDVRRMQRTAAAPDIRFPESNDPSNREIPCRYVFLNPMTLELENEEIATFLGPESYRYSVTIPPNIIRKIKNPRSPKDMQFRDNLPQDLRRAIEAGNRTYPLDPNKTRVFYYKKDDWKPWATPVIRAILPDLQILEKMKLADLAALDGAISCIRVWKLGSLENKVIPPPAVLQRLSNILAGNIGGGVMDLVWGPDIELLETSTKVAEFLGEKKYAPCLSFIFQGLGIPPSLYGGGQSGAIGYTNNSIAMRTFTERLAYIRSVLHQFWDEELRQVQMAMGFRKPATLVWDSLFTDQAAERQLYIHLADRDIISLETLQEMFGADPEIEKLRLKKQMKSQRSGKMPQKASPFHDANVESSILKILAQTGGYSPSELGVDLYPEVPGDVPVAEKVGKILEQFEPEPTDDAAPTDDSKPKPKGQPGEGRPKNSKDKTKRKQKVVKPRTSSAFILDVARAEGQLADLHRVTLPGYLGSLQKKTARELTETEIQQFEEFKFSLLCQFQPTDVITAESIKDKLQQPLGTPALCRRLFTEARREYATMDNRPPTIEMERRWQAAAYALYRGELSSS